MMSAEQRWGRLDPDTAITYTAKSDNESMGRWKLDRKKRFPHPVFGAFFRTITRLADKYDIPSFEVDVIFLFPCQHFADCTIILFREQWQVEEKLISLK